STAASIYTFGAELLPRRVSTDLIQNVLPLVRFSGLNGVPQSTLSDVTVPGVVSQKNFSGSTLAGMGVPSAVLQTFVDFRPQSPAAPEGKVPVPTLSLNLGSFFFQHERQLRPDLRITAGLRIELASVTEAATAKHQTRSGLYNRDQMVADAQAAEDLCNTCSGLTFAIARVFHANSFAVTP